MNYFIRLIQTSSEFIITICLVMAVVFGFYLAQAKQPFTVGGVTDPTVESSLAEDALTDKLPFGGSRIFVLYKSNILKTTDAKFKDQVEKSLNGLKKFSLPYRITSPYQNSKQISKDKHAAYATISLKKSSEDAAEYMSEFKQKLGKPKSLEMFVGGTPSFITDVQELSQTDLFRAEMIAVPLSVIALIIVFGTFIAGLLPMISGLVGITIIIGFMTLLGNFIELSIFVLNLSTMLGLGLSLDYTLLIVNRFREELTAGHSPNQAIAITLKTSGKAVFFSGITVLISLSALLFFKVNLLFSMGMGGVIVVIVSLAMALLFLPSLLVFLGARVNSGSLYKSSSESNNSIWFKLSMWIMNHPLLVFFPIMIFLLFLGYPFLHVKLNRPDTHTLPTWVESRKLTDEFDKKFNVNELTPILVVAKSSNKSMLSSSNISSLYNFVQWLKNDNRVDRVNSIVSINDDLTKKQYQQMYRLPEEKLPEEQRNFLNQTTKGRYTAISVIPKYSVNDPNTFDVVHKIRKTQLKKIDLQVGGFTAVIIDTIDSVYPRFFALIIAISIVTYLVLLILLRSIFLPLKAIFMNFLSISVSFGMLVYIFQDGHFSQLLNFHKQGFTDLNLPILLFCGIFGLSMDYEVFLLTRIKEFYEKTGDNRLSVALGLAKSAKVITSAALIIVLVATAFVTAEILFVKAFGLGLALAIAVDATIIRILLVPATMRLMGKWNWYLPRWLDRILPNITFKI